MVRVCVSTFIDEKENEKENERERERRERERESNNIYEFRVPIKSLMF